MKVGTPLSIGRYLLLLNGCCWLSGAQVTAATFTVSNTAGSGTGSFRQAIQDANAAPGLDTIRFQIPGTGVKTITLGSALPAVTDPVIIDGTTQPGYADSPLIEIDGANTISNAGLKLASGNSTVRGLAIVHFLAQGIQISGAGTNLVAGNFIGLAASGTAARPNGLQGIWISSSSGNLIGGTNPADRNVISGNLDSGIYILGGSGNIVCGNYIGTKATGISGLGNGGNGIAINNSEGNQIGGSTPNAGNVISANKASGAYLKDSGANANIFEGNIIGLGADGTSLLGNAADGITINNAVGNIIGGTAAGAGNVVSDNRKSGISISGTAVSNNVLGNLVGTDRSGTLPAGNTFAGVTLSRATNNVIGGEIPGARNVISANETDGVFISTNSAENIVAGNYIGLDFTGNGILANGFNGVTVSSAYANTIGPSNVIAGNKFDGINLNNGASGNKIRNNYVGTDANGVDARANERAGVGIIRSSENYIGLGPSEGNVISGNGDAGIYIVGADALANIIQGNRIGTDATATLPLGNFNEGIYIRQSSGNTIGGITPGFGNVISANGTWAISFTNTDHNIVQGNIIGTAADRLAPLGNSTRLGSQNNRFHSIELTTGCSGNLIGGNTPAAGNLIANTPAQDGVYYAGVRIRDGATNNAVLGNQFLANAGLDIDLGPYLVNANDNCDADSGANQAQNFPALTQAVAGNGIGISGTLSSKPNTTYRLEFFASPACNSFGHGEGEVFLGSKDVSTGPSCSADFIARFSTPIPPGFRITATATDPYANTSEFSACVQALPVPALSFSPGRDNEIKLTWPASIEGFVLLQADSLTPPVNWLPVGAQPTNLAGQFILNLPCSASKKFFLLSLE